MIRYSVLVILDKTIDAHDVLAAEILAQEWAESLDVKRVTGVQVFWQEELMLDAEVGDPDDFESRSFTEANRVHEQWTDEQQDAEAMRRHPPSQP